ncbi:MAG TPA: sugar phosphate nucleotidyltransferase [Patescibacteria group bacterium]|jgi:mannose-1-phosphate guanylyltransferase|nr:sugar phosphate nucleotidyltransferase [Patescibacteria group bacterium]
MKTIAAPPWALILAGGDGTRLRALTRQIAGDPRPKQFCPLLDGETLLDRTRRRVDLLTRPDRQVVIVTRPHEPYFRPLITDLAPDRLVVQPANRGTGAGLLYPLMRIADLAGDVPVAVFPSDHFVDDDATFVRAVAGAVDALAAAPQRVILLGIEAASPETEYGWIEPADRIGESESIRPIRRFWEKPAPELAASLLSRGCLWNSFVMVGRVATFIDLIAAGAPELVDAFEPVRRALGSARERAVVERVYARLEQVNFSERVLEPAAARLGVAAVKGVEWSDWGNAERVFATMRRTGWRPAWLQRVSRIDGGLTAFPTALSA